MDERRRIIRELEDERQASLDEAQQLTCDLGEALLSRAKAGEVSGGPAAAWADYRRLLGSIENDREMIKTVEAGIQRMKVLEEEIQGKEREDADGRKEIALVYAQLGRAALEDPAFESFGAQYRDELDGLLAKIESQEARLEELGQRGGNIFAWVGRNAQSLAVKAMLAKNQAGLGKIYRAAGEKFIVSGENAADGNSETASLAEKAGALRQAAADRAGEIASLRDERQKTGLSFGANPIRRIQDLEHQIARAEDELRQVYIRFGGMAFDAALKDYFAPLLKKEDSELMKKITSFKESAADREARIEKLRAAIAIDEEKADIEKARRSIENQRQKIRSAEDAIASLEKDIADAEARIVDLSKLL